MLTLLGTLLFRAWLAASAPFIPDEAYFALWGRHPDIGFYDHPPMVGWLLAALEHFGRAEWMLRLPSVILPAALALLVRASLRERDAELADWSAVCVLLVPMNVWNVFITTDTPLALFTVASLLAFERGVRRRSGGWFAAAGVLLGLAFLSKYFAVLLGAGYVAWALAGRDGKRWRGVALTLAAALPFGLLNLYWNYEACWCNVMFNAINRNVGAAPSFETPLLYAVSLAYLAGPLLYFVLRDPARLRAALADRAGAALALSWLVPFAFFGVLSIVKEIGLHWMLSFLPGLVLSVGLACGARALEASARVLAVIAALHVGAAAVLAVATLEAWKPTPYYSRLVYIFHTGDLLRALRPELEGYRLAADAYSGAALLAFHSGRDVPVFGAASSHSRQDDILTDWRAFQGRNILVLRREPPVMRDYTPYFAHVGLRRIEVLGSAFYAVLGSGFDYAAYRRGVLTQVRDRYYRIPAWLPVGRCYFCERYFGGVSCGR